LTHLTFSDREQAAQGRELVFLDPEFPPQQSSMATYRSLLRGGADDGPAHGRM
jgi:hypothetical protein